MSFGYFVCICSADPLEKVKVRRQTGTDQRHFRADVSIHQPPPDHEYHPERYRDPLREQSAIEDMTCRIALRGGYNSMLMNLRTIRKPPPAHSLPTR